MKAAIALAVLAIAFPLAMQALGQPFYVGFGSRVLIYAMVAASLNLLMGYGGMISFGHAAFFGAGAYVVGILAAEGVQSAWVAWPLAVGVSALAALAIGAVSLRTRGAYFIMITLAFAQMLYYVFVSLKAYGGDDGLPLAARSTVFPGVDLQSDVTLYYVVLALLAATLVLLHRLVHSRFGRVIEAIRENETRAEAIGFPVYGYQLACFVIAGAIAGLAGALVANQSGFVGPSLLHWMQSGTLMIMVIVGGVGRFWGGPIGAAVMLALEEALSGSALLGDYAAHWQLPFGLILLAIVLFAPRGIAGLFADETVLEIRGLSKRFGGVVATDALTLGIAEREVHAVIGPNGAGKTTLVAQLAGSLAPDAGKIVFLGGDLTHASQHARVRAGLVRSYQVSSLFDRSTVLDNLALAVQATTGSSLSFWRPVATEAALFDAARAVAEDVGLAGRLDVPAGTLAHGEQRILEVALALATRPRLVLLDEPMAGLGQDESQRMIELIDRTRRTTAVLLVEHDMDAVFRLADRVSVLVDGRLIATGTPAEVRANAEVIRAYLGDDDAAPG